MEHGYAVAGAAGKEVDDDPEAGTGDLPQDHAQEERPHNLTPPYLSSEALIIDPRKILNQALDGGRVWTIASAVLALYRTDASVK